MQRLGEFTCHECNMTFRSTGLLDKHKARFCIGSEIGDPVVLKRDLKEISESDRAAFRGLLPKETKSPDLTCLREQRRTLLRQRSRDERHPQDMAETSAINKLSDEFHKLRISVEESLSRRQKEELYPGSQWVDGQKLQEMSEHHRQMLAEIRARNAQLEQQREDIERQLADLAGHGGGGSMSHLEDLLETVKEQEDRNEEILHQLSTQISCLQGTQIYHQMKEAHVTQDVLEDKKTENVTFDLNSFEEGSLSSQIRSLQLKYIQSGGSDPEVLAKIHDLQAEASMLEQPRPMSEHKQDRRRTKSSHQAQMNFDVLVIEIENQRLEEEILRMQLARERHLGDAEFHHMQKHNIHQITSLQAEISSLKREMERVRERRAPPQPPPPVFSGPFPALTYPTMPLNYNSSYQCRHVLDPRDTLGAAPYDPVAGFVIFYDMVLGVDTNFHTVRLVVSLYSEGKEMGQPIPLPPVQCQPMVLAYALNRHLGNCALLVARQSVPRLEPSPSLSLIVEMQANGGFDFRGQDVQRLVPHSWAILQLFNQHNQVRSGSWRVPFLSMPVRPSLSPRQLNSVPQVGVMEICLRLVNARDGDVQSLVKIDPNNTSHYKYPPMIDHGGEHTKNDETRLSPRPSL